MLMQTKVTLKNGTVLHGVVREFIGNDMLSLLVTAEGEMHLDKGGLRDIKLDHCKKIVMTNIERPK
jgi:hypothetical protein